MLINFKPWHLDMMKLADSVRDILGKYPAPRIIERLADVGFAYSVVADEGEDVVLLGVVGAVPIKDGRTAEVFIVADDRRHGHRVAFVKAVRQILDRARARFANIEAVAAEGTPDRWFEFLGFKRAGPRWVMEGKS